MARDLLGGHSWKDPGGQRGLNCLQRSRVSGVIGGRVGEASGLPVMVSLKCFRGQSKLPSHPL